MQLHVRDLGSGPPIVFLHPGPGLDGSVFLPGAQGVADAGYRVLLLDLPGSGRSPAGDWTLAGQAEAVEDCVNELGLTDWTLLGHSFGGYVAMQHVVDYATADRYVASCTDAEEEPAPGVSEDRWDDDMSPEVAAAFEREASVSTPEECREMWRDQLPFFANDPAAVEPMLDRVVFEPEAHHPHELGELHALDALAAFGGPLLAIAAEDDRAQPPGNARRIAAAAPGGELLIIDDAGHFPFAEKPDSYWPALIDWLNRTSS
jgi:pimeloyl-ACP methyl ester carboxylesterase